jgi:hypothetical protein
MAFPIRKQMSPTSPLRDLITQLDLSPDSSDVEKALKLVDSKLACRHDVVGENLISGSSYDRGVRAEKEFRDPGVPHHPNRLTKQERQLLLERVKTLATTRAAPTAAEVRDEVCCFSELFIHFTGFLTKCLGKQNHSGQADDRSDKETTTLPHVVLQMVKEAERERNA